jgi:hypothetical protein
MEKDLSAKIYGDDLTAKAKHRTSEKKKFNFKNNQQQ